MSQIKKRVSAPVLTTKRLEALADGLFAIVMTLLVLELSIPVIAESSVNAELTWNLLELWPKLLVYMLSFVILGTLWVSHHSNFHYVTRSDGKLAWMNIVLLMFVALIPFSASLLGEYSHSQVAVAVYGINILFISTMGVVMWIYIIGKHLLTDRAIDVEVAITRTILYMLNCLFYIIGISISFISPIASLYIYGLAALMTIRLTWMDSHGLLAPFLARIWIKRKQKL